MSLKNLLRASKVCVLLITILCITSSSLISQGWVQLNDAPFIDDHTNGFGYEGVAYVFRGRPTVNDGVESNELWTYEAATDTWTEIGAFPGPARRISIGDDWNGKYYYGFGNGPSGRLSDLWEFDPVDTSFTELPSCPCIGRTHPSLIAHNDKIYMGAGSTQNGDIRDWWEYDMETQVWTQKENIPGAVRHHMFHFSIGKYVYVGGGHVNNWNRWDPEIDEWTPIDDLPQGRVAGTQFQYGGLGFLLAGDDRFHVHVPDFETFMYYSEETKEWDYLPPLPNGSRWAPSSFIIGSEVFFMGGISDIVNGDVSMWKYDLSTIGCLPPTDLNVVELTENSAGLLWTSNAEGVADTLKWRVVGDEVWNDVVDPEAVYMLEGLESCQEYEVKIVKNCGDVVNESETLRFKTDGCCINPALTASFITDNSATIEWPAITAAEEYTIRWRSTLDTEWNTDVVEEGPYQLEDLDQCTEYEFQIESKCTNDEIDFSESLVFLTNECGACIDLEYCAVENAFTAEFVFINKVGINDYLNESGSNLGYGSFVTPQAEKIYIGDEFTFTFEPGYEQGSFAFAASVWVDLDGSGTFDEGERLEIFNSVNEEITEQISIPVTATPGLTKLRVMYSNETDPCAPNGNFVFGEVEDYCIILEEEPTSTVEIDDTTISAYPNPFTNTLRLKSERFSDDRVDIKIYSLRGELIHSNMNHKMSDEVNLPESMKNGVYLLSVMSEGEEYVSRIVKQDQ